MTKAQGIILIANAALCAAFVYLWQLPAKNVALTEEENCPHPKTCCRLSKWKIACHEGGDGSCVIIEQAKTDDEDLPYCVPMGQ